MAAIPTVLYFGDEQISGGPNGGIRAGLGTTGPSQTWGIYRHNKKLNKPVPSDAGGINPPAGVTEGPYWDGTLGNWVQFFPVPGTQLNGLLPLAFGDNWYEGGSLTNTGAVTPCALLMHSLWERFGNQIAPNPGFKVIKQAFPQGFGGASGWRSTGSSYAGALATVTAAASALAGGNTLDVRAIIIDCSTTDLFNNNTGYIVDAASFVDNIRASLDALASVTCAATTPIILVNHHQDMLATTAAATRIMRRQNAQLADVKENLYLFDMNWAVDWQQSGVIQLPAPVGVNQPAVEVVNKRYYAPETYLQEGFRLGRFLEQVWAADPPLSQGSAIPVVVMLGDSQFVGTISPELVYLTDQESLLGPFGGSVRDYQYVWDAQNEVIEQYDVMANSNTFGTVSAQLFGPDTTFLKRVAEEFPNGIILFKYARNGVSLTLEANGAANAVEKDAATIWDDIAEQWMKFKTACLQTLGLSPDCVGIVTDLGSNDEGTAAAYNAFATKAGEFVDDIRELFSTRATGGDLPVVWLQPPPHIDAGGNSGHNNVAGANSVRATIAALPSQKENLSVVLNTGADKYELKRSEVPPIHYGGEANLQIGYDLADALIPLIGAAAGSPGAGAGGGVDDGIDIPSENAPFVVETGTGSATANSYCSEAVATAYHETYGNPDQWIAATPFDHQDALRQATRALDFRYGSYWSGVRVGSTQALDWPRAYAYDAAGNPIPATTIPARLQQATAILALMHIQGEDIMPSTQTGADIKSETLSSASGASKSVTYIGGKRAETQFPIIDRMLMSAGLTSGGAGWGWLDL